MNDNLSRDSDKALGPGMKMRHGRGVVADVEGREVNVTRGWYRGDHTHFWPSKALLQRSDAIERFILRGLTPEAPFIDVDTTITTFGSCFAGNISKYLNALHYNVPSKQDVKAHVVQWGEGLVHTYAIRQQFEWALEGAKVNAELWHGTGAQKQSADEETRENTRRMFMKTDVFILTFGLSEVWYSKATGDVFWRAVPTKEFDPEKHGFRLVSTEENRNNMQAIYDLIRKHRPEAKVICTLSPVPLAATFRPIECIVANGYSKGSLRVALDEVYRANAHEGRLFYWPSYEIITEGFQNAYAPDHRHPRTQVLLHMMRLFEEFYCIPSQERPPLIQTLTSALMATGQIGPRLRLALAKGNKALVLAQAQKERDAGNVEFADVLKQAAAHYDPGLRVGARIALALEALG